MSDVHRVVGFVVVAAFTVGWLLGLALWIGRRQAGIWFWRWLAAAQVLAIVQALIGIVLLIVGRRPLTWLHLVYGFGPIVVFGVAHSLARDDAFRARPWMPFAMASFVSFGLTLRALTTGLGIG